MPEVHSDAYGALRIQLGQILRQINDVAGFQPGDGGPA